MIKINVEDPEFETVYCDIKERYLSRTYFPKLIVGTGLSVSMNIPGMTALSEELSKRFNEKPYEEFKETWDAYKGVVVNQGLEAALLQIPQSSSNFVENIRTITGRFILAKDYESRENIVQNNSGFEKLLNYLSRTVSPNNNIIDIMTPNYDLIIEAIADKLNLPTVLGFSGNLFQKFDNEYLRNPYIIYRKNVQLLRLFKPHGSVNWINNNNQILQVNDYSYMNEHSNDIEIIAPGSFKYEYGMTHEIFRAHRECFNEIISSKEMDYSIFVYGYGFHDSQFDIVFENTNNNVIVLTMELEQSIINRALTHKNWTLFYKSIIGTQKNDKNDSFMVYKGELYIINQNLWDLNVFSNIFFGGN